MTKPRALHFTEDPQANELLATEPVALLIGMLLDQQVPMERAFLGPYLLKERLGGKLETSTLASIDPEELAAIFAEKPALHRFPASMAKRTQALCAFIEERYGGRPETIWLEVDSGGELYRRLLELPGFGKEKVGTLIGILAKLMGIRPQGWEERAPDHMTLADVTSFDDVADLREAKRARKGR